MDGIEGLKLETVMCRHCSDLKSALLVNTKETRRVANKSWLK